MSRSPKALLSLLALSTLAVGTTACGRANGVGSGKALAAPTPEPIRVTAAPVEARSLPRTLEVTGALAAEESADVAAERDGRVADVLVERGSFVEKGAVLARLDDRDARASLQEAKASLAWSESEVARYTELRDKQVVAKAERQRKDVDLDLAKARLDLAQKAHEDCWIRAPFSGLVTEKKISAGAFVRRGQAVAGLVKVEPLRAELAIPEAAAGSVKPGQTVRLRVQTFPDREFEGKIAYVGPSLRSEARTLVVEARVPNAHRLLKPGLFATASIDMPSREPMILAPKAAIVSESGVSRVYVLGAERVAERLVQCGAPYGDRVEIRQGLARGERVVLNPDRRLVDGLLVAR